MTDNNTTRAVTRQFVRIEIHTDARYRFLSESSSNARSASSEDIAKGGVCLLLRESLFTGQKIMLSLRQPYKGSWSPEIQGTVVWCSKRANAKKGNSQRVGVHFTPTQAFHNRLRSWLPDPGSNDSSNESLRTERVQHDSSSVVSKAYDSSTVTFRFLRAFGWGSLVNLGFFRFPAPLSALNLLYNIPLLKTQHMLPRAQARLSRKVFSLLEVKKGDEVLDIACGRGQSSFTLACTYPYSKVTGLDILSENIEVASALYGNVRNLRFVRGDATNLQFDGGEFQKVFCLEAAFHFVDRERFLEEAYRVMGENGRLVVIDFMWKSNASRNILKDERTKYVQNEWKWRDLYSIVEYKNISSKVGFRVDEQHCWSHRVTGPIQYIFNTIASIGSSQLGRAALHRHNPLLQSMTDTDWREFQKSAKAHDYVRQHVEYVALILRKI